MVFEGVMTALVTPMRDRSVDYDALGELIEHQIAAGIHGLVAVGTTGESATLNFNEHVQVIKHVVHRVKGRVPVIAGAGANSTAEAIELSKASEEAGADALLQVVPYYNKPTQEGLHRHFAAVAEASRLPIILYNVPGRTACDLTNATIERLADLDNVVAVKDATGDMRRAAELIARVGARMSLLSGDDFTAFPLFSLGARGVISVVSNAVPARVVAMWRAVEANQWADARAIHLALLPFIDLLFRETSPSPVKAALELLGLCGPEIRLPLCPCTPALREQLKAWMEAEGVL
jgi:4-hydroxy-tetrahydrodipicolinate synthase